MDEAPNLVEGYAYFKLCEYIAVSEGFSAEISQDNLSQIGASLDESQLALATERFEKLRSELEAKPVWVTEKSRKKRTSDKESGWVPLVCAN
jgi:hypothetical protein